MTWSEQGWPIKQYIMLWIDVKFANLIGSRLSLFKVKKNNPFTANFRCYVCGDSKKNQFKTRGYFFTKGQSVLMSCHNCGASKHINTVLKDLDPQLAGEYKLELLANRAQEYMPTKVHKDAPRAIFAYSEVLKGIKKISELPYDHPAVKYINKRQIPTQVHYKLYYAPRFKKYVNSLIPDKFDNEDQDEPRLILPFIDSFNNVYGFQGRAFHDKSIRYITIMLEEDRPKVFGWDNINRTRLVNVVEGPLDSLFIDNCIALAGSDGDISEVEPDISNVRLIYDNEPRNAQITSKLHRKIDLGYNVFIWPDSIKAKDINDLVIETKMDRPTLQRFIEANTFQGLRAKARFSQWSMC